MDYKRGRISGSEEKYCFRDQSLWYNGQCYHIDRNMDFVNKHNLSCIIENVVSPAGRVFNVYRGIGRSVFGSDMEFACAVQVGTIE